MITARPCGACRALVPVDEGCEHWRMRAMVKATERRRDHARYTREARARAKADVDKFRQAMAEKDS